MESNIIANNEIGCTHIQCVGLRSDNRIENKKEIHIINENAYWSRIPIIDSNTANRLYEFLSIRNPNARWSNKFKLGKWDGMKHFFSKKTFRFPYCLTPFVKQYLESGNFHVRVDAVPKMFPKYDVSKLPSNIQLRDYQEKCIQACLINGNGIVKAPTSSGKTLVIASLIKLYNTKTLVLVHRKSLAEQIYNRFCEFGIDCDLVHGESSVDYNDRQVCILLVQSAQNISNYSSYRLLIVDEIHSAIAKTFNAVVRECTNAYNRFGFSATVQSPKTLDGLSLVADYGKMIYNLEVKDILDSKDGLLSNPNIIMVLNESRKCLIKKSDEEKIQSSSTWASVENRVYVYNIFRNMLISYIVKKHIKEKIFVLVRRKDHGEFLSKILGVEYLCGETPIEKRKKMIADFEQSESGIMLGNEQVLGVGIDIRGGFDVMINCSGSKTDIPVLQKIGRALRKNKSGKVKIYDFMDDDINTRDHSNERMKIYKKTFGDQRVSLVDFDKNDQLFLAVKAVVDCA